MRHHVFDDNAHQQYSTAILIKETSFDKTSIQNTYVNSLAQSGVPANDIIAFTLKYGGAKKVAAKTAKAYLSSLLPALRQCGVERIYCADAEYFKILTGERKADPHIGYVLPCKAVGYENMDVILGVNYRSLIHNPNNESKLAMSLQTVVDSMLGQYKPLGSTVVEFSEYPKTLSEIADWLQKLHQYDSLSCDIETFGLQFHNCGLASITFTWSEHEGIAFLIDYQPLLAADEEGNHGIQEDNKLVKALLKEFFDTYKGNLIFHNAAFDTKVMIYELWMNDLLDNEGLLTGLSTLYRDLDDTKIMAYLCLNTCSELSLSLKDLAHEFAGSWAQDDIADVRKIPADQLLQYNLIDGLSTFYLKKKFTPLLVSEQQRDLYDDYFMPYQMDITQIELTGMPVYMPKVKEAKKELQKIVDEAWDILNDSPRMPQIQQVLTDRAWDKDFKDRRDKAKHPENIKPKDRTTFPTVEFNPGSPIQLGLVLFELFGLPVLEKTATGKPATGDDVIEYLPNHTNDPDIIEFINAIRSLAKAQKILSTFIPPLENAILKSDGWHYLHGGFNLGGTVSGRLSSSKPNLQNLPSGSKFGKLIKDCFRAPKGWIFCGADFNSLEDYISALTTKDPQKLKVYIDGYDGHCLRAFSYFKDELSHIEDTVDGINSIKKKHPELRQKSKGPTFALTYGGTNHALQKQCGFTTAEALRIEANYHELYKVSDEWVQDKLDQAAKDGYVEVAFGLRVRTPMLQRALMNNQATPREALAEGRTAGNALGQSYGQLTNRSMKEFLEKVRASKHRNDVRPVAMIHDANYFLIRDNLSTVQFTNTELIRSMEWQDLPEIEHEVVKLGAALDLFHPSWANEITLPNYATGVQIQEACKG